MTIYKYLSDLEVKTILEHLYDVDSYKHIPKMLNLIDLSKT